MVVADRSTPGRDPRPEPCPRKAVNLSETTDSPVTFGDVRLGRRPVRSLRRWLGEQLPLTVTHPRGREKALKPVGWLDRRTERIMDARPEMLRRGVQAEWRWAVPPGIRCPASAERPSVLRHPCPEPLPGAGARALLFQSSQPTPCNTPGLARGGPAPLRSPRESRSLGGRAWGAPPPFPPCRCGVMPERRSAIA